jgi:hypothetical protein
MSISRGLISGYIVPARGHPVVSRDVMLDVAGLAPGRRFPPDLWSVLRSERVYQQISLYLEVATVAVGAMVGFPVIGPFQVEEWSVQQDMGSATAGDYAWLRLDFSGSPTAQTPVFNATGLPTGLIPDGVSLWGGGSHVFSGGAAEGVNSLGWVRLESAGSVPLDLSGRSPSLMVPESYVFPKLYAQNENAAVRKVLVRLLVRQLVGSPGDRGT